MDARRQPGPIGTQPAATPDSDRDPAADVAGQRAGSDRFGTVTLANGWENANVASPGCAKYPSTKMSISPKSDERRGRRPAAAG